MNATANLREVDIYQNGDIHASFEPKSPKQGTLLDRKGEQIIVKKGLMVKLDEKAAERVNLSKGTILAMTVAPALLMLVFNYGMALWNKSADDSAVRTKVEALTQTLKDQHEADGRERQRIQDNIDKLNQKFDGIKEKLNEQAVKDAERKGQLQGFTLRKEGE